jgi:hypothetical protein
MRSTLLILFVSLACVCSAPAIPGKCKSSMFHLWMYLSHITPSVASLSSFASYVLHSSHTIPIAPHSNGDQLWNKFTRKYLSLLQVTSKRNLMNYLLKQTHFDSILREIHRWRLNLQFKRLKSARFLTNAAYICWKKSKAFITPKLDDRRLNTESASQVHKNGRFFRKRPKNLNPETVQKIK